MYFFQFPMKGERKRKKDGKEKGTCSRASTNNLTLVLTRVISFGVPADDLYAFQILKRISTSSLDLSRKKIGSKRLIAIYPLWGEGEEVGRYRWLQWS